MGYTKTLKQKAEEKLDSGNAGHVGDPVSLEAGSNDRVPTKGA